MRRSRDSSGSAGGSASRVAWWQAAPVLEDYFGATVVRDDLLEGGSKIRFLPFVVGNASELVFGGPFCGGAPYALSVWGRRVGVKVTLFYAKRNSWHWRQTAAQANGAAIVEVPAGRIGVVQHRAREYAKQAGALFLPLGFDVPNATEPFEQVMHGVRERVGRMDEVWCATGSGMLARCLGRAFPDAKVRGVIVGLKSRNQAQSFPANVELVDCPYDFADEELRAAPFPSCRNYDAKAWQAMLQQRGSGKYLFWNVLGNDAQKRPAEAGQ